MRKKIFCTIFIFLNGFYIKALGIDIGHFIFAYAYEFNENGKNNYSFGQDYRIISDNFKRFFMLDNYIGFNYRFGDNGNILNLNYSITPKIPGNLFIFGPFCGISYDFGGNISYNINKNVVGIGPQIDLRFMIVLFFTFNVTYRYNFYFNRKNSHEIGFTIGIIDFLSTLP